jgi:HAD superfamily hydrolase (TIGR01509 family)
MFSQLISSLLNFAVAWDLEGPLINFEDYHFQAHSLALQEQDIRLPPHEITAIEGAVGGGDDKIAALLGQLFRTLDTAKHSLRKRQIFQTLLSEIQIQPRPGVYQLVQELHQCEVRQAGRAYLKQTGLDKFMSATTFKEDVTHKKPHPEVYLRTAEKLGVRPQELLVFEDSVTGVLAAVQAGATVIATPIFGIFDDKLLEIGAKGIIKDWNESSIPIILAALG